MGSTEMFLNGFSARSMLDAIHVYPGCADP